MENRHNALIAERISKLEQKIEQQVVTHISASRHCKLYFRTIFVYTIIYLIMMSKIGWYQKDARVLEMRIAELEKRLSFYGRI